MPKKNIRFAFRLLLPAIFSVFSLQAMAQDSTANHAFKVYANFAYAEVDIIELTSMGIETQGEEIRLGYFTPAFNWYRKGGDFHELEISDLRVSRLTQRQNFFSGSFRQTTVYAEVKYEYNYSFFRNRPNRFKPYLGYALGQGMLYYSTDVFGWEGPEVIALTTLHIVPRLQMNVGRMGVFDLSMPVSLLGVSYAKSDNWSPEVTVLPTVYMVRLGFGLRF